MLRFCSVAIILCSVFFPYTVRVQAEQYLTKDEALVLVLGADCEKRYEEKTLSEELISKLKAGEVYTSGNKTAHFFLCMVEGRVSGYALIDSEIGKHLPIIYIIGISPLGAVTQVEIMSFREVRGDEITNKLFLQQFEGLSHMDTAGAGKIRHITGATLSSVAISRGVKRALMMWQYYYGGK